MAAIESNYLQSKSGRIELQLSEQQLIDCTNVKKIETTLY